MAESLIDPLDDDQIGVDATQQIEQLKRFDRPTPLTDEQRASWSNPCPCCGHERGHF